MQSQQQGMFEPYRLSSGPHLFTDWRFVRPGQVRWEGEKGQDISLFGTEGLSGAIHARALDTPHDIRLVAQPAHKTGALLHPDRPWEHVIFWPTLLYDEGKYRLWYEAVPGNYWTGASETGAALRSPGWGDLLCCAESDDLEQWTKPALGVLDYEGQTTNIVYGGPLAQETGFHGAAVFIDPSASPAERHKMLYMGKIPPERAAEFERKLGAPHPVSLYYQTAIFGAVSPDGLRWTALPEPVMLANSDTGNVAYFDRQLNKYVGYFRIWLYGRRAIGRSETDDFGHWPLPEPVLWPGPGYPPTADIYTNARSTYPGATDQHLMFPALYLRDTDRTEVHIATSQEGKFWSLVPGGPVLVTGEEGSPDSGCLFIGSGLVPVGSDRVAAPYVSYSVPHKYPRSILLGEVGLAVWPAERLVALEAPGEGCFTTPPLIFQGRELRLNLLTARAGEVRVEVAAAEEPIRPVPTAAGAALPGHSLDECDSLWGNHSRAVVTWQGQADLGAYAGQPVVFRFRLRAAKLFAFSFD